MCCINIEKDNHWDRCFVVLIRFPSPHWIFIIGRTGTFSAAGDGGFGQCWDVSVSVICDAIKAASFRFNYLFILFTFYNTKQRSVSSADVMSLVLELLHSVCHVIFLMFFMYKQYGWLLTPECYNDRSLWNLTCFSAVPLSRYLFNFRAIGIV